MTNIYLEKVAELMEKESATRHVKEILRKAKTTYKEGTVGRRDLTRGPLHERKYRAREYSWHGASPSKGGLKSYSGPKKKQMEGKAEREGLRKDVISKKMSKEEYRKFIAKPKGKLPG